jgi:ubiquinone/menaquinone biosynthesis C-methylase UbiE
MSREQNPDPASGSLYFKLQADFGFTKHPGGLKATRELVKACHISQGSYVLEIGCGIGKTPCKIVEDIGCQIVGIDLSAEMVKKALARAHLKGMQANLDFAAADAQALPFNNDTFDAVICESVNAFVPDKAKALQEYTRVVKPGGYIGINEVHWKQITSPELTQYARLIMAGADFLTEDGWKELFEKANLGDIAVQSFKMDMRQQRIEEIRGMEKGEGLGAWKRFLTGLFRDPDYWEFTKQVLSKPRSMFRFMKAIGYGLYVGKK